MKELLTRNEVRDLGLKVSSTQFLRYEKDGLLKPVKVGNRRSARVHYRREDVEPLIRPNPDK